MQKLIYIGDISKNDAKLIAKYANKCSDILEFGCGASTQVMAQSSNAKIKTVDTSDKWIRINKKNISDLGVNLNNIQFIKYDDIDTITTPTFDMIYNDGKNNLRPMFAMKMWSRLKIGGHMLIHDTRNVGYLKTITDCIGAFFNEISQIKLNANDSNISIIEKCSPISYKNWNKEEEKEPWMLNGMIEKPNNWKEKLIKKLNS